MNEATPQPGSVSGATPPWIGRVVDDRYRVVEKLGEGGMGAVYVAEHLKLRKMVALKVIHPELTGEGEMLARFAREAMATAQLDHPHVASALDYGSLPEGGAYLVMQLVRGKGLREILESGRIPWPRAAELAAQVADALAAAHAAGIVHRDLKPENVLLEPRADATELIKVLDFGIARIPDDGKAAPAGAVPGRALTRVGTIIGTPGYMAPEQALGEGLVDGRADLYALGVILWEMIVGKRLWAGAGDVTEIFTAQLTQEAPHLREASGDATIPDALDALVAQLLSRKRDERPDKAGAVRDALRQLAMTASMPPGSVYASATGTGPVPALSTARASGVAATVQHPSGVAATVPLTAQVVPGQKLPVPLVAAGCGGLALLAAVVVTVVAIANHGSGGTAAHPAQPTGWHVSVLPVPLIPTMPGGDDLPPAMQADIDALVGSEDRDARRSAAVAITSYEHADRLPPFAPVAARLELARRCREKKPLVVELGSLGDRRALPVLMRLDALPPVRSGLFGMSRSDPNQCMATELDAAITALGGDPNADEAAAPTH